ncbi:class I SAM-dependent methyltransferase [Desmospora activa]|uniref:Ubiquinone/menaquinone biosynthesis C-methylase UbiE n=1 Tax=Desmospora activa DSM 45169 TaxID=1121389 RepID=A0A2T4Z6D7_9BACL|nr:methyltransferase domain-containing protein [Desmospora activa]PTM57454.1 ubiquinone/menaquinone biosynthesis C-methylase UbiE [Desmospora activa DSM 45169]
MSEEKKAVQTQFGKSAAGYVGSDIHAKGQDLTWLVQEVKARVPRPLLALDVATGTGHTAFALREYVPRVVGFDLTAEMLEQAQREAAARGLDNLSWMMGDAENIPLPDHLFDVVTLRIAAHHFPHPLQAFQECRRLLAPGGIFILVDNVAPDDPDVDRLYNQVEKWRDPSHGRVYTEGQWSEMLQQAGFLTVEVTHRWQNRVKMDHWFARAHTTDESKKLVHNTLQQANPEQQQLLGFDPVCEHPEFILRKAMWVATR